MSLRCGSEACDRCGAFLGRRTHRVSITRGAEAGSITHLCEGCGKRLATWLGRDRPAIPDRHARAAHA